MSLCVAPQISLKPNTRRSMVGCRVVFVVTIFSTQLCCMQCVSASCGNYLYRNGSRISHHSMPVHEPNGISSDFAAVVHIPVEIPVRHCSGPNCSSRPIPLAPVPAVPGNLIRGFDQAALMELVLQTQTIRCAIEIPESERGARFEPSSVFRPPAA